MFIKFGDVWVNPAYIEVIKVVDHTALLIKGIAPSGGVIEVTEAEIAPTVVVRTASGNDYTCPVKDAHDLLNMLGIATDKATIIHNLIAEFMADWPGLEYGVAHPVFGQGNLTDTVINQAKRDIQGRLSANGLDSAEREELLATGQFVERLLKFTEADRIAAMNKARQNGIRK